MNNANLILSAASLLYSALFNARLLISATFAGRSPQTEAECAQEWRELMEKQAREGL